jgi:hypothetical protein
MSCDYWEKQEQIKEMFTGMDAYKVPTYAEVCLELHKLDEEHEVLRNKYNFLCKKIKEQGNARLVNINNDNK